MYRPAEAIKTSGGLHTIFVKVSAYARLRLAIKAVSSVKTRSHIIYMFQSFFQYGSVWNGGFRGVLVSCCSRGSFLWIQRKLLVYCWWWWWWRQWRRRRRRRRRHGDDGLMIIIMIMVIITIIIINNKSKSTLYRVKPVKCSLALYTLYICNMDTAEYQTQTKILHQVKHWWNICFKLRIILKTVM